jgi:hypothetical protein
VRGLVAAALTAALVGLLLAVPGARADGDGDPDASPLRADTALFGSPLALSFALGTQIDVSNTPGSQGEVSVAASPADPQTLIAASNDIGAPGVRVYTSTDGGTTWTSVTAPRPTDPTYTFEGDPSVGIGQSGRQYLSFLAGRGTDESSFRIFVTTRANDSSPWIPPVSVDSPASGESDDKDQLTVARIGATDYAFVAWDHNVPSAGLQQVQIAAFDGATTSAAVNVSHRFSAGTSTIYAVPLVVGNTLYVAWHDASPQPASGYQDGIYVTSAPASGALSPSSFKSPDVLVAPVSNAYDPNSGCDTRIGLATPAQPRRCVLPNPSLTTDGSTLFVTWADLAVNGAEDVFVRGLTSSLTPAPGFESGPRQVNPPDGSVPSDQSLPWSAYGSKHLWACYYDTFGDISRSTATESCSASADGGLTWSAPMAAASSPSDETQAGADLANGFGDYEGLAVDTNGSAHPLWTDSRDITAGRNEEVDATVLGPGDGATQPPRVMTGPPTVVGSTTATVSGVVTPRGQATTFHVDYGPTTGYGSSTSSVSLPADQLNDSVTAALTGLTPGATYHYRVVASNGSGTTAGADNLFILGPSSTGTSPVLSVTGVPHGRSRRTQVTVRWSASDASGTVTFAHSTDGKPYSASTAALSVVLRRLRNGRHSVFVRARDAAGHTTVAGGGWIVDTLGPALRIIGSRHPAGATIVLHARATDPAGVRSVRWSFGDGSRTVIARGVRHHYAAAGRYVVTVTARDRLGNPRRVRLAVRPG